MPKASGSPPRRPRSRRVPELDPTPLQTPHDALFKAAFSKVTHARAMLRDVLPPELSRLVRWSTLKRQPGSFIDEALRERHTDLLFAAQLQDRPAYFYFLFEHQSTTDRWMLLRLLQYMVRIWQEHLTREPNSARLPVIVPVVLHHSDTGWTGATAFEELMDLDDATREAAVPFVPRFALVLDDVSHVTDDELRARALTALGKLVLACFRHARDMNGLLENLRPWGRTLSEVRRAPSGLRAFALVVRYIFNSAGNVDPRRVRALVEGAVEPEVKEAIVSLAENLRKLGREEGMEKGLQKGLQKGRQEGRQEGRQQGRAETVLKLLQLKFGRLPAATTTRVRAASEAELERWTERVLTGTSAADVLDG